VPSSQGSQGHRNIFSNEDSERVLEIWNACYEEPLQSQPSQISKRTVEVLMERLSTTESADKYEKAIRKRQERPYVSYC
jgi:hypothetical protein